MDVKDNFKPKYAIIKGKEKLVSELKEARRRNPTPFTSRPTPTVRARRSRGIWPIFSGLMQAI